MTSPSISRTHGSSASKGSTWLTGQEQVLVVGEEGVRRLQQRRPAAGSAAASCPG
jgi:hypothetical protein